MFKICTFKIYVFGKIQKFILLNSILTSLADTAAYAHVSCYVLTGLARYSKSWALAMRDSCVY